MMERETWGLENGVPVREGIPKLLRSQQLPEEQTLQLETLGSESAFISPTRARAG